MKILTTNEIVSKFQANFISINKLETKGKENGMICVIYRDYPLYFPTYYTAYCHFNQKGIII